MKGILIAVLTMLLAVGLWLFAGSAVAQAGSGESDVPVEGRVNPVVESYARDYSVSYEEAGRRLDRIGPLQDIMAAIRDAESFRLAGWGIDHADRFGAWVWLTGDEPPSAEAARIVAVNDDVEIRTGAAYTYEELRAAQDRFAPDSVEVTADSEVGSKISDMVVFTGIDMETNSVEIGIDPAPGSSRVRRDTGSVPSSVSDEEFEAEAAWLIGVVSDHIGVGVTVADGRGFGPTADFNGGENMESGESKAICTAGFAAKQNGGSYGIITAGHCSEDLRMHGRLLTFSHGWESKTADAQFHQIPAAGSHKLSDDYKCRTGGKLCDVKGLADRKDMIGEYVCHTGRVSGISCGEIKNTWTKPTKYAACLDSKNGSVVACSPVFVKVKGLSLKYCRGDSGGPWYDQVGVAYGIHHGSVGADCTKRGGRAIFSAIREVEKFLGVEVLTEDPSPPSAPEAVEAVVGSDGVSLSWESPPEGAVSYRVYRRAAKPGQIFSEIGRAGRTSYFDPALDLASSVEYQYQVKAINNLDLESDLSAIARVTIPAGGPGHGGLRAVVGSGGVSLSWPDPGWPSAGYEVYRRAATLGESYSKIGQTSEASFVDPVNGLTPGTEYYYRIKTTFRFAMDPWVPDRFSYARVVAPAVSGPDPVGSLEAVVGSGGVSLTWTAPKGNVARYEVYRRVAVKGESYGKVGTTRTASFVDPVSGLTPGTEYYYRVKAVGSTGVVGGWGSGSNYARVVTPAVGGLNAVVGSGGVSLTWTALEGDVASYEIHRRVAVRGQSYTRIGTVTTDSYSDPVSGLTPGTEYYYRVKAVGSTGVVGGWGSGSNYARVVTPAVGGLNAVVGSGGVSLTWTALEGDVARYEVYRRVAVKGESYGKVGTTRTASFVDPVSGLTPGTEYYYRVKAVGSTGVVGGWGSGSNYARVVTPAVGGLNAVVGSGGVSLTWTALEGDVARYEVYRRVAVKGESYGKVGTTRTASFVDPVSGLTPGTEYYYRVKAVGSTGVVGGWGSGSNYARVVTPAAAQANASG